MRTFDELFTNFSDQKKVRIGVVSATDETSILSVFHPKIRGFLDPILIGPKHQIEKILEKNNLVATIVDAQSEDDCAKKGVELVRAGTIDFLMKGHIQTRPFLKAIVNKESGIAQGSLLSHVAINELPAYHKFLLTSDGGMLVSPNKQEKRSIIYHAIQVMNRLGIKKPKIGLLAAAELVNPTIPSSVEAFELMKEFQQLNSDDCFIDGPISLDLSLSQKIAEMKEYKSPVAGDADIVIGPDITTMNVLGKSLTVLAGGKMAGIIMGAKVPIVMTSRGATEEEKINSIIVAMYVSRGG